MPAAFMPRKWSKRYIRAEATHTHRRSKLKNQHEAAKAFFQTARPYPEGLELLRILRSRNTAYLGSLATLRRMHLEFHIQILKEITARELATADAPPQPQPTSTRTKGAK